MVAVVIEANARRQPARGQICDPRAFCPHGKLAGNLWAEAVEVNRFRHPIRDVAFWSAIVAHPSRRADRLNPLPGVDSWKPGRVSQVITREVEQDEIVRSWPTGFRRTVREQKLPNNSQMTETGQLSGR
jgi:hypothetical protein